MPDSDDFAVSANPYASPASITRDDASVSEPPPAAAVVPVPVMATVFGVLNLVWGVLGVFGVLYKLLIVGAMVFMSIGASQGQVGPNLPADTTNTMIWIWAAIAFVMFLWTVADILLEVMLFTSGIQLLQGRNRGRIWGIRYSLAALVLQGIPLLLYMLFVVGIIVYALTIRGNPGPEAAPMIMSTICQLGLGIVLVAYPLAQLLFLRRPDFRDSLQQYESWRYGRTA